MALTQLSRHVATVVPSISVFSICRNSAVQYSDGAVVYLDRENYFTREPLSAKFRSKRNSTDLALHTVHARFGEGIKDRAPEIKAYWEWMQDVYIGTPIVLFGDFNLSPALECKVIGAGTARILDQTSALRSVK
jgi:hypothetical protein